MHLKKVKMLGRVLEVPEKWDLANPEKANQCHYAYAVCVKGTDVQPIIWFSNCGYQESFSKDELGELKRSCEKKDPIISQAWVSSCLGIFAISIVPESGTDDIPYLPYGAKIICEQKG